MKYTKNLNKVVRGADSLSLGISIVVAVILGALIGVYAAKWSGVKALFWLFLFLGFCAAGLNIKRAYAQVKKDTDALSNDPKYQEQTRAIEKARKEKEEMERKMRGESLNGEFDDEIVDEWDKEDAKWK